MAGSKIALSGTAGELQQDVNGAAKVNLPLVAAQAGFAKMLARVDDGSVTGTEENRAPVVTIDGRFRTGQDAVLFSEQFPGAALNTTLWQAIVSTMTVTVAGGTLNLNAGVSAAAAAVARATSQPMFPISGEGTTLAQMIAQIVQVPQSNNVTEWGLFLATGVAAPTDGVFFRLNAASELRCIVSFGGVETQSPALNFGTLIGAAIERDFAVACNQDVAEFFIGGQRVAKINRPVGQAAMTAAPALPLNFRTYNTAIVAVAQQFKLGVAAVALLDVAAGVNYEIARILAGATGYQGQTGQTLGSTANYANNTNAVAAVPTNTTAALGTGLGGQFRETDTLAVDTDGIICSYQVPVGSNASPGRTFMCTGISISSYIQVALTGGGYNEQWVLAFGHTALSLATVESNTSKAPRRKPIASRAVAAALVALTQLPDIVRTFSRPIPVYPGEFVAAVKKKVGTAPTAGVIAHVIDIEGYWL
jgi:hypothetical protein